MNNQKHWMGSCLVKDKSGDVQIKAGNLFAQTGAEIVDDCKKIAKTNYGKFGDSKVILNRNF